MCLEVFEAFKNVVVLADDHFDESEPMVTQVQNNWRQYVNDHVLEGFEPETSILRVHRPRSPNRTGSHEDNDENNNNERSISEEQSKSGPGGIEMSASKRESGFLSSRFAGPWLDSTRIVLGARYNTLRSFKTLVSRDCRIRV